MCYDNDALLHILDMKKSWSYFSLIGLYRDCSDKLEVILPFVPSTHRLYQWLFEAVDLPEMVFVKCPCWVEGKQDGFGMTAVRCESECEV